VLVIAILHFVGGGIGIMNSLCGLAGLAVSGAIMGGGFGPLAPGGKSQVNPMRDLEDKIPAYQAMLYTQHAVSFGLSCFMIVAGIGLVQMKPWGRTLSIVYALLSILNHVFMDIYNFGFVLPGTKAMMRDMMAQDPQVAKTPMGPMMENMVMIGPVIQALFIIYPIVVVIIMLLPPVRAAFLAPPLASRSRDDYDGDEPDDAPWGRRRDKPDERIQPDER
jgi:hypothetical protein